MSFDTFSHQIVAVCRRFYVDATFGRACVGGPFPEMLSNIPIDLRTKLVCHALAPQPSTRPNHCGLKKFPVARSACHLLCTLSETKSLPAAGGGNWAPPLAAGPWWVSAHTSRPCCCGMG